MGFPPLPIFKALLLKGPSLYDGVERLPASGIEIRRKLMPFLRRRIRVGAWCVWDGVVTFSLSDGWQSERSRIIGEENDRMRLDEI